MIGQSPKTREAITFSVLRRPDSQCFSPLICVGSGRVSWANIVKAHAHCLGGSGEHLDSGGAMATRYDWG